MEFGVNSCHSEWAVINFSNFRLQLIVFPIISYHVFEGHSLDKGECFKHLSVLL